MADKFACEERTTGRKRQEKEKAKTGNWAGEGKKMGIKRSIFLKLRNYVLFWFPDTAGPGSLVCWEENPRGSNLRFSLITTRQLGLYPDSTHSFYYLFLCSRTNENLKTLSIKKGVGSKMF